MCITRQEVEGKLTIVRGAFEDALDRFNNLVLRMCNITVAEVELIWEMAQLYEVARTICCTSQ